MRRSRGAFFGSCTQHREQVCKIVWQRCFPTTLDTGHRVHEPEAESVERLPSESERSFAAIGGIADERVAKRCEMYAYLVRPTGFQVDAQERVLREQRHVVQHVP